MDKTPIQPQPFSILSALESLGKCGNAVAKSIINIDVKAILFSPDSPPITSKPTESYFHLICKATVDSLETLGKCGNALSKALTNTTEPKAELHIGGHDITITKTSDDQPLIQERIIEAIKNLFSNAIDKSIRTILYTQKTVHEFFHPIEARVNDAVSIVHEISMSAAESLRFGDKERLQEIQRLELLIQTSQKTEQLYANLGLSSRFFAAISNILLPESSIAELKPIFEQRVNTIYSYDTKNSSKWAKEDLIKVLKVNEEIKRLENVLKVENTDKELLQKIASLYARLHLHPISEEQLRANHRLLSEAAILEAVRLEGKSNLEDISQETSSASPSYPNSSSANSVASSPSSGVISESQLIPTNQLLQEISNGRQFTESKSEEHPLTSPTSSTLSDVIVATGDEVFKQLEETEIQEASIRTNSPYSNPVSRIFFTDSQESDRKQDEYDPNKIQHSVSTMATSLAKLQVINKELQGFIFVFGGIMLVLTLKTSLVAIKTLSKITA